MMRPHASVTTWLIGPLTAVVLTSEPLFASRSKLEPTKDQKFAAVFQAVVEIQTANAKGAGFFINPSGDILTNYHVVGAANEVKISLYDGRAISAKVVAFDQTLDLAILKSNLLNTPFLSFATQDSTKSGDDVYMFGSPAGLSHSAVKGIVASVSRNVAGKQLIQLDAHVNPGLSGGPVTNQAQDVIGVVNSKINGASGIGFAIRNEDALNFLLANGSGVLSKDSKRQFLTNQSNGKLGSLVLAHWDMRSSKI